MLIKLRGRVKTQGWIKQCSVNFKFSESKKGIIAAERHWVIKKKTVALSQPIHSKDVVKSEWKEVSEGFALETQICLYFHRKWKAVNWGEVFWKPWPLTLKRAKKESLTSHCLPLPAREAWARNTQLPTTDRPMSRTLASCNAEPTTGQSSSRPMSRT